MFLRKKSSNFTLSKEDLRALGFDLTEEQCQLLSSINYSAIQNAKYKKNSMFVYNILLVIKALGLIPSQKCSDESINITTKHS